MFDLTPKTGFNSDQAVLLVGQDVYNGWQSFSITRSLEAPSGAFTLTVSDKWPGQPNPWPIQPGHECQVNLGSVPLVTGYVDEVSYNLGPETRAQTVTGRDKTGDLVDCSYVDKPDQWRNSDVATIVTALAAPFGVSLNIQGGGDKITNFKVEPGETAFEAIARICKLKGLLAWPDGRGGLQVGQAGKTRQGLTIKETDCLNINVTHSHINRHSEYQVKGQQPTLAAGRDAGQAKSAAQVKDVAQDPAITRHRPLMIISEGPGAEARERALWEAAARAGRGLKVELTLPGFVAPGGQVWSLGHLVGVSAPGLCLADELLISQVQFDLNPQAGHTTTLSLCRPDAFKPEPVGEPKNQGGASAGLPSGTIIF